MARLWEVGKVAVLSEQFMSRIKMGAKICRRDLIIQTGEESSSQCLEEESLRSLSTSGKVISSKAQRPGKFRWLEFKIGRGRLWWNGE